MAVARVASRYAKALLSLAEERGQLNEVAEDLATLDQVVAENRELELMLQSPLVKADKKQAVLDAVFGSQISDLTKAYLRILIQKGREGLIKDLTHEGNNQLRVMRNIQVATVTTAVPLDASLREKILTQVSKVHQGEIELTEHVDADILGGYILQIGDRMIDASVKRQIRTLGRELTEHDYEPEF
ncbi:MAG: ATP synthase F1 subunit delta [Bacteroidetes bacterium]|nr:ATP synthase F1 subunit delta [Bacteroidota bacterium]MDA0903833.1 ATP synthase F1 subunit delta [Bacteroidota bacterium]MDA1242873.1 ATP synthase F1 subunit delta [Bacteroidota bacterium]